MKKVAIVGLGWLGMPLAMSLSARGWQVTGSKTTQDGVEAARMSGIDSYLLRMEPELVCDSDDLDALMDADALVITLPARRSGPGDEFYLQAVQELVDSALAHRIPRIIFTSSTSVYGDAQGTVKETTPRNPVTNSGGMLYGTVVELGPSYPNIYHIRPKDEIISLSSLTVTPLHITQILRIDCESAQLEVEGQAILYANSPVVKKPPDLPLRAVIAAMDEAGAPTRPHQIVQP